jgi:2-iminoacetate synthase
MYNVKSKDSNEFINHDEVLFSIEEAKKKSNDKNYILTLVEKARQYKGLTHREAAVLLEVDDDEILEMMYKAAKEVKEKIYGKRIVIFAPLYLSNYCVNNCRYCGYKCTNDIARYKLTQEELVEEVKALQFLSSSPASRSSLLCPNS